MTGDYMSLSRLFAEFTNGDETSWAEEMTWLGSTHPRRLARIRREIKDGFFPPVRLCYRERRVVDGHHRLIAAHLLGLAEVPVADAWDGSGWEQFASDSGADDPEVC